MKPEIFDDEYLEKTLDRVYRKCLNSDCDRCPVRYDVDNIGGEQVCKVDLIMELWRRLENAKERKCG